MRNPALGKLLADARAKKKLTVRALGEISGLDYTTIFRMEQGKFSYLHPAKLQKLAQALDLDTEDLYDLAGYPVPVPELAPYLRTKFDLSADAADQVEAYIARLRKRYEGGDAKKSSKNPGGGRGQRAR